MQKKILGTKNYSFIWVGFALLIFFLLPISLQAESPKSIFPTVLTGQIKEIKIKTDEPSFNSWLVLFQVESIKTTVEVKIGINEILYLHTNGIVRIFGGLKEEILNKRYELYLSDVLTSKDYLGQLIAKEIK